MYQPPPGGPALIKGEVRKPAKPMHVPSVPLQALEPDRPTVGMTPLGELWQGGTGQAPVKRYNEFLRDPIVAGRARPGKLVSHRLPLEGGPDAYAKFDHRGLGEGKGYPKAVLKPWDRRPTPKTAPGREEGCKWHTPSGKGTSPSAW